MSKAAIPALPCMCASLRRASRALSQRYEEALRPLELTITQFTLLQALSLAGEISHRKLGEILAMDSTTLTRTLGTISKHGWIRRRSGEDRRERYMRLSASGEAVFRRALPHWEGAQAQLRRELGNTQWDNLMTVIHELTAVVAQ